MGGDGKISIVLSHQCLSSNGTFTFVLPHYIEYHASNRPTEHDNLPVLIQYTDTGLSHRRQTKHFFTNDLGPICCQFCQNIYSRAQNAPHPIENSYYLKERAFKTLFLSREK